MSRTALLLIGLVSLLAAAIAAMPAKLAADLLLRPAGVTADLVTGSVWDARLYRIQAGGQRFATGRLRLAFWPLLTGRARAQIALEDETASARGTLVASPGRLEFRDGRIAFEARRVPGLRALAVPQTERLYAELDRIVWRDGICDEASGDVTTPLLSRLGQRHDADLPELAGTLSCAGEALALGYDGRSEALTVTGSVRVTAEGYRWVSEASTGNSDIVALLIALGFEETGQVWRAEGEGSYR